MTATAEAPSRNGSGPKRDPFAYRNAVRAKMKKPNPDPLGGFTQPTEDEVSQFLLECQIYRLEPLAGQIYAVWEHGAMRAVTTIDGMRALAERTGRYDGQSDPEWCDKEGNWTDYWPGEEAPLAARVRVHRKGTKVPTTGTANWHDFAPNGNVGADSLWNMGTGKPAHMLSIRAEAVALRKAFPSELSGLYAAEELGISLSAIGTVGEESSSVPVVAVDGPSPKPPGSPTASAPSPMADDVPAVIVDPAAEQPSGAPARPQVKRTLAEALATGEYQRLRGELTEALFDQLPDRLTDKQGEVLTAALVEAEQAGITPVELERLCKVALKQGEGNVETRSRALLEWITERRLKAEAEVEPSATDFGGQPEPHGPPRDAAFPGSNQSPSLLDKDPGPEPRE